jgi:quinol monooxygenase YgiN
MFSTSMRYKFKPGKAEEAAEIWKNTIFNPAIVREGIVALEFMINEHDEALAIGIWEKQEFAQAFMQTGIFKTLLQDLDEFLLEQPEGEHWTLTAFGTVQ